MQSELDNTGMDLSSAKSGCMGLGAEMADRELFCQWSSRKHEIDTGMKVLSMTVVITTDHET